MTYDELRAYGDFGLGTYEHMDGEMLMLDGELYQIHFDGSVRKMPDSSSTP